MRLTTSVSANSDCFRANMAQDVEGDEIRDQRRSAIGLSMIFFIC